ncbi:hypothetical protein TrRE_jg4972 [Triparma retinervis]|uniref:Uncharacterized protein n=1 Tax=Triparma retinervis TaxID=2557542 RepID=A0A9W6ZJN7_9STRA|nr:hypothetical protein TrRE_jg4972 [Triparma retinervis]
MKARVVSDPAFGKEGSEGDEDIVKDIDRRVEVIYPRGSTYRVRRGELYPIFEESVDDPTYIFGSDNGTSRDKWHLADTGLLDKLVLVCTETDAYRRLSMLHVTRSDTFLEIGCDYGICIGAVLKSCAVAEPEPRRERDEQHVPRKVEERILGVDISEESIGIARKSHEGFCFEVIDALSVQGMEDLKNLCDETLGGPPTVVAIDINGVREVEAVQKCIRNAMTLGPRLIIVKSRNLFPLL